MSDFKQFITEQNALLKSIKYPDFSNREYVLAQTVKISEELGELCDEIFASLGMQRKDKMEGWNKEDLEDEFADVVITTFLLAHTMEVDVMEALGKKIEKIKAKHNKQLG